MSNQSYKINIIQEIEFQDSNQVQLGDIEIQLSLGVDINGDPISPTSNSASTIGQVVLSAFILLADELELDDVQRMKYFGELINGLEAEI